MRGIIIPRIKDQEVITMQKFLNHIWHSKLFIKEGSRFATNYLRKSVEVCQGIVDQRAPDSRIDFDWTECNSKMTGLSWMVILMSPWMKSSGLTT